MGVVHQDLHGRRVDLSGLGVQLFFCLFYLIGSRDFTFSRKKRETRLLPHWTFSAGAEWTTIGFIKQRARRLSKSFFCKFRSGDTVTVGSAWIPSVRTASVSQTVKWSMSFKVYQQFTYHPRESSSEPWSCSFIRTTLLPQRPAGRSRCRRVPKK